MTHFQQYATSMIAIWAFLVLVRFRRSAIALLGGLVALGAFTLAAVLRGDVTVAELGLNAPGSWLVTIGFALAGLALMLIYSPVANWVAKQWADKPPTLDAFNALKQSRAKLAMGIVAAWVFGGVLEELLARGIVLQSIEVLLSARTPPQIATILAIAVASVGAGALHLYQGLRAVIIVTQLSILLGGLFVVSEHDLWSVILCHGLYDTVAFVRFAQGKSSFTGAERST